MVTIMHEQQAREYLVSRIAVTRQKVVVAKAFILDASKHQGATEELIKLLLRHVDATMPPEVVLHQSVDPVPVLVNAAEAIAWRLAASEAVWELVHSDMLIQTSVDLIPIREHMTWTTVIRGSGGSTSGWTFDEYSLIVPRTVARPRSLDTTAIQPLSNHDLYIHEINITNMHPDVQSALKEAVGCFRHELFTACLAMLGKASEGAWLELGAALIDAVPPAELAKVEKQRKSLENPTVGIGRKIEEVLALYDRQDIFLPITEISGVRLQDLRATAVWSDAVRDSRNTIHFGVQPSMANSYEKVAALLIGAVPHFRILYRIAGAAQEFRSKRA